MKPYFEVLSVLCAGIAGVLWFLSARVKIPQKFPIQVTSTHTMVDQIIGAQVISTGSSPELDDLARAIAKQSRLSAWAAGFACAAAISQAIIWACR
jgi:phosphate/sulfate permease